MRNLNRSLSTARQSGGFTLVELLVVIGIIAILAGVALGPITNGIKKAQESAAMQTTRTLALAEFQYANDNNGSYPDGGGGNCSALCLALMSGNYITDPTIFYLSADKTAGTTLVKGTSTTTFTSANSSYDFSGVSGGTGVSSTSPDQIPLVWDEGDSAAKVTANGVYIASTAATGVFGADGKAVCYHSNNSFFRAPAGQADPTPPPAKGDITFVDKSLTSLNGITYTVLAGASTK